MIPLFNTATTTTTTSSTATLLASSTIAISKDTVQRRPRQKRRHSEVILLTEHQHRRFNQRASAPASRLPTPPPQPLPVSVNMDKDHQLSSKAIANKTRMQMEHSFLSMTPPPESPLSLPFPDVWARLAALPFCVKSFFGNSPSTHFLFGYGSLINSSSRRRTFTTSTTSIPVTVRGLLRSWSYHCPNRSYTAVTVSQHPTSTCNGVLIPIPNPQADLTALDARESLYDRVPLHPTDITITHDITLADLFPSLNATIWVYKSSTTALPLPSHTAPIPQSYVDCILQGCLGISEAFALDFVRTTVGWDSGCWINDRACVDARTRKYVPCIKSGESWVLDGEGMDGVLVKGGVPETVLKARVVR
ncbi:hypothetical protein BC829DRAFT_487886 [Chytridium lagenaria]|nr:hypothetical protein BC829DRAFT_487886 [Chytridium lagenaria]